MFPVRQEMKYYIRFIIQSVYSVWRVTRLRISLSDFQSANVKARSAIRPYPLLLHLVIQNTPALSSYVFRVQKFRHLI